MRIWGEYGGESEMGFGMGEEGWFGREVGGESKWKPWSFGIEEESERKERR